MADATTPSVSVVAFTVYGAPSPAGSKTLGRTKAGRTFVRDSAGRSGAEWRRSVAQQGGDAVNGGGMLDGPLELTVVFVLTRPAGHYGKRGLLPSAPAYPTVRPDTTKLLRAVEDALTGILWRDDAAIVTQQVSKRYGEPVRAEITVRQLQEGSP